jgi:hypothetical protein
VIFFSAPGEGAPRISFRDFTLTPLPFLNKQSDRPHQMLGGDIDIPFPENLRDPVNADSAPVRLQDLFLAFLWPLRSRTRRRPRPRIRAGRLNESVLIDNNDRSSFSIYNIRSVSPWTNLFSTGAKRVILHLPARVC